LPALGAAFGLRGLPIAVGLVGCRLMSAGGPAPSTPAGSRGPDDRALSPGYAGRTINAGDHAEIQSHLAAVRTRLQRFEAEHGRFPDSPDHMVQATRQPVPAPRSGLSWSSDPVTGAADVR